jgi:hypothetical protein
MWKKAVRARKRRKRKKRFLERLGWGKGIRRDGMIDL